MKSILNNGYILMVVTAIAWSGNSIIGRGLHDVAPSIGLAFWRWMGTLPIFLILCWPYLKRDWPIILHHWKIVLMLAVLSVTIYNAFIYQGLTTTSAINSFLLNTSRPMIIVLISFILFKDRITPLQGVGFVMAFCGTLTIIARGDLEVLAALNLNKGDFWILSATMAWALYTVLLGNKPKVHATSLLFATVLFGQVLLTPFYIWETVTFKPMPITLETIGGIAYLAVISSVVAYLAYNRTVELLGANKAGLTSYLLPIFGSLFAVILLGESIRLYHVVAFALIIGGVSLAARTKRRTI